MIPPRPQRSGPEMMSVEISTAPDPRLNAVADPEWRGGALNANLGKESIPV